MSSPDARKSPLCPGRFGPGPTLSFFTHDCKHMFAERTGDVDTVARSEQVEADLDRLITKRHDQRVSEEQGRIEDGWTESVRAFNARRREALYWEWLRYHQRKLNNRRRTFALLDAHDRAEIARYERMLGIDHEESA